MRHAKHIGHLLRVARKLRRLTADEVGSRCNVNRSRVYQWEKARFILPKNLPAISKALNLSRDVLIAENGNKVRRGNLKKPNVSKTGHLDTRLHSGRCWGLPVGALFHDH